MSTTTVKIRESTKSALDEIKNERESYDEVIGKLLSLAKNRSLKEQLIEGYKARRKEDLEILKEWEGASAKIDEE